MAAQQGERELAGKQFVISEPRPRFAQRLEVRRLCGTMHATQRLCETRKILLREPCRVLPFGQIRNARERHVERLAELVRVQPFGHRVDRIDQRQRSKALGVDHALGMEHLQVTVVERRGARNVTQLALGQELFQIILAGVEIGDGERIGVVARLDIVRGARPVRRRWPMPVDGDRDRHHRVGRDLGEFRLVAPIDKAARQMEQQIDDARRLAFATAEKPREHLFELRPNAGQGRQGREQWVERRRTHTIAYTHRHCRGSTNGDRQSMRPASFPAALNRRQSKWTHRS